MAPEFKTARQAWGSLSENVDLESSETEVVSGKAAGSSSKAKGLEEEMRAMQKELFGMGVVEEDEDSETDDEVLPSRKSGHAHLAPGTSSVKKERSRKLGRESKEQEPEATLQKMMMAQLHSGASPSELMPLMMMQFLMQQNHSKSKQRGRARSSWEDRDSAGSSGSDDSEGDDVSQNSGMKAVVTLNRLHRRIRKHPKKIIREFEKELVEELGVVPGQSWTVKDWKFKGMMRSAIQDAQAYEMLRAGDSDAAAAQLVQNMKSKLQCVLAGGDWETAWLLTGIQDPLTKKEWAGSREEMAIISGYVSSLHKLKKKMKEANQAVKEKEDAK